MSQDFFDFHIERLREKYPVYKNYQKYHIFTILCIKYFFFSEAGISFDQDIVEEYLTDGANDGGIDAIFNDPTSESNDMIIVQSKFYENTELGTDNVAGELYKINETLKNFRVIRFRSLMKRLFLHIETLPVKWRTTVVLELFFLHLISLGINVNEIN